MTSCRCSSSIAGSDVVIVVVALVVIATSTASAVAAVAAVLPLLLVVAGVTASVGCLVLAAAAMVWARVSDDLAQADHNDDERLVALDAGTAGFLPAGERGVVIEATCREVSR